MADEILGTISLRRKDDDNDPVFLAVRDFTADQTNKRHEDHIHLVGTSEEAVKLGELTALGWCAIRNYDDEHFVEIRTGTGGTRVVKVPPLSACLFHFGSGVTAPYIIADTAECKVRYLICDQ